MAQAIVDDPRRTPAVAGVVAATDAKVERPLGGLDGAARSSPFQSLLFVIERLPDALDVSGIVAGQGKIGAGGSALDRHAYRPIARRRRGSCRSRRPPSSPGGRARGRAGRPQSIAAAEQDRGTPPALPARIVPKHVQAEHACAQDLGADAGDADRNILTRSGFLLRNGVLCNERLDVAGWAIGVAAVSYGARGGVTESMPR